MAGDLLAKLNMNLPQSASIKKNADKPAAPAQQSPKPVQTSAAKQPQLEYSAAITLSPPALVPLGIKPHRAAGHIVSENIFQSAGSTIKGYGQCAKSFYDAAFKGEGTDYSVGKINDLTIRAGSLGIAGILAATKAFPAAKGMEFIGLATWFGAMAIWPKVIAMPVKAIYGVDPNLKYIDSYGRRKDFFEDHQYQPYDMFDHLDKNGKYNKNVPQYQYLNRIGDKLGVPRNIENRNDAIQDKMSQVATQSRAVWMLTAGFMTPIISSLVADALQKPLAQHLEKTKVNKAEVKLSQFDGQLTSLLKEGKQVNLEKAISTLGIKIDPAFDAAFGAVAKSVMNNDELKAFNEFIDNRYVGMEMLQSLHGELIDKNILNEKLIPFDGSTQKELQKVTAESVESFKTQVFEQKTKFTKEQLKLVRKIYEEKGYGVVTDDLKIGEMLKKITIKDKFEMKLTSKINNLKKYENMAMGEFDRAISGKEYSKFGLSYLEKLRGLNPAEIDSVINSGNFAHRSDGIKGFGKNQLLSAVYDRMQDYLEKELVNVNLTDAQKEDRMAEISKFFYARAEETVTTAQRSMLDVEKAKKLLKIMELNKQLEGKIEEYSKVTIKNISESITANNWGTVPPSYLKLMGFTKDELKRLATQDTRSASKIVEEKFAQIASDRTRMDKVVAEMSKYAQGAIGKEEKAMLNIIGTIENPGALMKINELLQQISANEGFSNIIQEGLDGHFRNSGEAVMVKYKNTVNSFGKPIKALDAFSRIDDFIAKQLGTNANEFMERFHTTAGKAKYYTFQYHTYEESKEAMQKFLRSAFIENADINNWSTKFETALEGMGKGIKSSKDLLMDLNGFMYGDVTSETAKSMPPALRQKFTQASLETGFKFMFIKNKLILHVSEKNVNNTWGYIEKVLRKANDTLTPEGKTELLKEIDVIDSLIEGRRFDTNKAIITDLKKTINGFREKIKNPGNSYDIEGAIKFLGEKIGGVRTSNKRMSMQTGKGVSELLVDAARAQRARNKWTKLVWGIFGGTAAVTALSIALMGKKNYFNKDVYAKKGGNNAVKK